MSPIKIIHALKRLEAIDRDIEELRTIEKELSDDRSYTNAIKISLELQINNLLNEKVKLMELRISNPPDNLTSTNEEYEPSNLHKHTPFRFHEHENAYLPLLLNREDIFSGETNPTAQKRNRPDTGYRQPPTPQISIRRQAAKSLVAPPPAPALEKKTTSEDKDSFLRHNRNTKNILKNLPTLED